MTKEEQKAYRKVMFDELEHRLRDGQKPEDCLFYYHPNEDRIVLSHTLFWVMTATLKGKLAKEKYFLLLRQYQEEMLDAFLQVDDNFHELLRYCNILYEYIVFLTPKLYDLNFDKAARKLAAISVVASGFGGDMPEDLANDILDDIDYLYNKVKCRKIESMLPILNDLVQHELNTMGGYLR